MRIFNAALIASFNFIQQNEKRMVKKKFPLHSEDGNTLEGNELKTLRGNAFLYAVAFVYSTSVSGNILVRL